MNLTRRDALLSTALAAALSPSELASAAPGSSMSHPTSDGVSRSATRVRGFSDPEMDFQLLRSLGVANYMGASVGEVLAAGRNIKDGDPRTWPPAFVALGEQTVTLGRSALEKQHPVSARDHFQRASMYYRAAEYYDDPVTDTSRAQAQPSFMRLLATPSPGGRFCKRDGGANLLPPRRCRTLPVTSPNRRAPGLWHPHRDPGSTACHRSRLYGSEQAQQCRPRHHLLPLRGGHPPFPWKDMATMIQKMCLVSFGQTNTVYREKSR
jgi:hypothetical protein